MGSKARNMNRSILRSSGTADGVHLREENARLREENAQLRATVIGLKGASVALWEDNVRFQRAVASESARRFEAYNANFASVQNILWVKALAFFIMLFGRPEPSKLLLMDISHALDALEENIRERGEAIKAAGFSAPSDEVEQVGRDLKLIREAIMLFLKGKKPISLLREISRALGPSYERFFDDAIDAVQQATPGKKPSQENAAARTALLAEVVRRQKDDGLHGREVAFDEYMLELVDKGRNRTPQEELIYEMLLPFDPQWPTVAKWFTRYWEKGQINLSIKSLST